MCEPLGVTDNSGPASPRSRLPDRSQRRWSDTIGNDYPQINFIHAISTADVPSIRSAAWSSNSGPTAGEMGETAQELHKCLHFQENKRRILTDKSRGPRALYFYGPQTGVTVKGLCSTRGMEWKDEETESHSINPRTSHVAAPSPTLSTPLNGLPLGDSEHILLHNAKIQGRRGSSS